LSLYVKFIAAETDNTHAHQIRYVALQRRVTVQLPLQLHSGPSTSFSFLYQNIYKCRISWTSRFFLSESWSLF